MTFQEIDILYVALQVLHFFCLVFQALPLSCLTFRVLLYFSVIHVISFPCYVLGTVGDWQNWFTVAQNEKFDSFMQPRLKTLDLEIKYTI